MSAQTSTPTPPARAISQPQRVVDGVTERIHNGTLQPGDRVPGARVDARIWRQPVCGARGRLPAAGQRPGDHTPRVGTFVLESSQQTRPLLAATARDVRIQQVLAMLELRISLESEAAHLAALRRTDAHLIAMRAALDALNNTGAQAPAPRKTTSTSMCKLPAPQAMNTLKRCCATWAAPPFRAPAQPLPTHRPRHPHSSTLASLEHNKEITQREHEEIYDAIRRQDAAAARAAMLMHLIHSRERLRIARGDA